MTIETKRPGWTAYLLYDMTTDEYIAELLGICFNYGFAWDSDMGASDDEAERDFHERFAWVFDLSDADKEEVVRLLEEKSRELLNVGPKQDLLSAWSGHESALISDQEGLSEMMDGYELVYDGGVVKLVDETDPN